MVIFSYISLVFCIYCYFSHCLSILKVAWGKTNTSGTQRFILGQFFLMSCVYFASTYGWTF